MRRFKDFSGNEWDAVVGRESWGAFCLIFVPVGAGRHDPVRQAPLRAANFDEAQQEIDRLDASTLSAIFLNSVVKDL